MGSSNPLEYIESYMNFYRTVYELYHYYHPKRLRRVLYAMNKKRSMVSVFDGEWDNLIILDSCRYDALKCNSIFEGDIIPLISPGITSTKFMERNFSMNAGGHNDVIMITAAKWKSKLNPDAFFRFFENDQHWDPDLRTIPPKPVIGRAKKAMKKYPNKRLILWLMQPHSPFINENGKIIEARGWGSPPDSLDVDDSGSSKPTVYDMLRNGELTRSEVWTAYTECLKYVQRELKPLINDISGQTVITADHGTAFGDRPFLLSSREYGGGTPGPETMVVPWFTLSNP